MFELSKQCRFEAAHTLQRQIHAEPSQRILEYSYRAEKTVRGPANPFGTPEAVRDLGQSEFRNDPVSLRGAGEHIEVKASGRTGSGCELCGA